MLFWIFVAIMMIGIIFWWSVCEVSYSETRDILSAAFFIPGVLAVIGSLIAMGMMYIGNDGYVAQMNERRESLIYQYENDIYDNDNDLGKRELMVDIQEWNEDLASNKANQRDFWIGIYIPNIYDQFEFIELEDTE